MPPLQKPGANLRGLIVDPVLIAGGVETIRFELLPRLAGHFESLVWAVPECVCEEFKRRTRERLKVVPLAWPRTQWRKWARAASRRAGGSTAAPASDLKLIAWLAERFRPDFLLTTCAFDQPIPRTERPIYSIVCDLNPALPTGIRGNILEWTRRSSSIFAISEFTRGELQNAVSGRAQSIWAAPLAAPTSSRSRLPSAGPFTFLYPATLNGHKEHLLALQAAERLAREGLRFRIVLTGPGSEKLSSSEALRDARAEAARSFFNSHREILERIVIARGAISPDQLAGEYADASAMLLPSSYEGFGLPLCEGLAWGLPVVCSDIPPFLEQLDRWDSRDRAEVFPSGDADALAAAMRNMLAQPKAILGPDEAERRMSRWTWAHAAKLVAEKIGA